MDPRERLIVAFDFKDESEAVRMAGTLKGGVEVVKIGLELYTSSGPSIVRRLTGEGFKVFLDLKFHDIPNTVSKAVAAATRSGAFLMNLHASGGEEMMRAAGEASKEVASMLGVDPPKLLAVTVLTSLDEEWLKGFGLARKMEEQVLYLSGLAKSAGLDGVVASAREAGIIRDKLGEDFLIVTPGIRPSGFSKGDQKRTLTPGEAIRKGADYIVVGRPITASEDPLAAAESILSEMESALGPAR